MDKISRDQFATYINTTPGGGEETWALLGVGVTGYGVAYNPQVTTEHKETRTDQTMGSRTREVTV